MGYRTIEQKISATADFDGAAPVGAATYANDMESYPEGVAGGLFSFDNDGPIEIRQFFITLGGQTDWTLSVVDADAAETVVESGTTETYFAKLNWQLILLSGQKLKLETTAAATAMKARVTFRPRAA